jgi:hypothetical protein
MKFINTAVLALSLAGPAISAPVEIEERQLILPVPGGIITTNNLVDTVTYVTLNNVYGILQLIPQHDAISTSLPLSNLICF